jgi:nucleoside-diphosphate-sugar epimerase
MRILITGGGGFLGSQLAQKLLARGTLTGPSGAPEPLTEIVLLDAAFHRPAPTHPTIRVTQLTGDISDRPTVFAAAGVSTSAAPATPVASIFHLASMVSGECEQRFDDALRVNLDGGRHVFEAARALTLAAPAASSPSRALPRVVFASSIACYSGESVSPVNSDTTKLTPRTTYGMTKAICELLLNDHSRKGHFDGRTARLPTVIIRPGQPNAAASSWASGMFREPLAGQPCALPVRRDQGHPMTGYRTVIDSFIALHEVPAAALGDDRAYVLPAHTVTPALAESTLRAVAATHHLALGPILDAPDARIQGIVSNWPVAIDASRALALGLPSPPPLHTLVEHFLEDFGPSR